MTTLDRIRDLTDYIGTSIKYTDDVWLQGQLERIIVRAISLDADLAAEREKVRVLRGQLRQVLEAADPVDGETLKPDSEILDDINWQSLEAALDAILEHDPETTNPGT